MLQVKILQQKPAETKPATPRRSSVQYRHTHVQMHMDFSLVNAALTTYSDQYFLAPDAERYEETYSGLGRMTTVLYHDMTNVISH